MINKFICFIYNYYYLRQEHSPSDPLCSSIYTLAVSRLEVAANQLSAIEASPTESCRPSGFQYELRLGGTGSNWGLVCCYLR